MKIYLSFLVSLLLIGGCASLEPPVIESVGNTFSSSKNPAINIELPLDFKYLGHVHKMRGAFYRNYYIYTSLTDDNYLKKMVGVQLLTRKSGGWSSFTHTAVTRPLKFDDLKVGSKKFQYEIVARKSTGKLTDQFLMGKGIIIPKCNMSMLIGRTFPEKVITYIHYFEDLSNYKDFEIDSCEDWRKKEQLNDMQKKYLQKFEQRALNTIKIY